MPTLEEAKTIFEDFHQEASTWLKNNSLTAMPEYSELTVKAVIGQHYRDDTLYFESVSDYKSRYFALRSYFNKAHADATREGKRDIDTIISQVDDYIKLLDTSLNAARARLKLYESIIYLVSNFSYGDY